MPSVAYSEHVEYIILVVTCVATAAAWGLWILARPHVARHLRRARMRRDRARRERALVRRMRGQ